MTSLEDLRQAMARLKRRQVPLARLLSRAAVAAIARASPSSGAELLFIRRAEHPKDPWSGHMAFPGGRMEPGDADPLAAALRETREEIALDLSTASLLGPLSHVPTMAHGRPLPMIIQPYLFALAETPPVTLSDEVQEVVWVPVDFFRERANRSTMSWKRMNLPCYRWEGRVIWGLTLKMVDELTRYLSSSGGS